MSKKYKDSHIVEGIHVEVKDDFNKAIRLFGKRVQDSGMMKDLRDRMSYEPKSVTKQRKKKMARKRWEKKVETMIESGCWHSDKPY